jgi:hypothetical protein
MNSQTHYDIAARLDLIKSEGLISDFWISWVGCGGKLEPRVCGWTLSDKNILSARQRLDAELAGLVPSGNIIIKLDR